MRIAWHGHSCFEFFDGVSIVIDPHDGRSIGIKPPSVQADIVLVSHDHYDHNATRIVRGSHTDVLGRAGDFEVKGMPIKGIPTFHDESRGSKRGRNVAYVFTMDGIRICHCGDLGHYPDEGFFRELGDVDVLLVPTGGVFTLNIGKVMALIERVSPRIVIPMHYRVGGLSIAIDNIDVFMDELPRDKVFNVGNVVELYKEDMLEGTEYWIFSL